MHGLPLSVKKCKNFTAWNSNLEPNTTYTTAASTTTRKGHSLPLCRYSPFIIHNFKADSIYSNLLRARIKRNIDAPDICLRSVRSAAQRNLVLSRISSRNSLPSSIGIETFLMCSSIPIGARQSVKNISASGNCLFGRGCLSLKCFR